MSERKFLDNVTLAVRHTPDAPRLRPDGTPTDGPVGDGNYDVGFLEPDGTFVPFANVKGGAVTKQRRLAAERAAEKAANPPAGD